MRTLRLSLARTAIIILLGSVGAVDVAAQMAHDGTLVTPEVFVQGAPIHGANGVAVDEQGRILIASVFGHEVAVLDPSTGEIVEHIGPVVADTDVGGPDDVAVAPDGSVCWTDILGGHVNCLRSDGSVDHQFVAQGVNPIAFMPDGRLFVALAFFGDDLYELDPALEAEPRLIMEGEGDAPWPNQLNGFDFGPDGLLYAPRPFTASGGEIGRIDVDAPSLSFQALASGVPVSSVEFDAEGVLHASLPLSGEIARVDADTGELTTIATLRPNIDNMAFGPEGQLYVSNSHDGGVDVVEPDGQVRQLSPTGLILPGGIACADLPGREAQTLYVADLWSMPEFSTVSGEQTGSTLYSNIPPTITEPWTVAPVGDDVLVTSWMSNLVQLWDVAAGKELASWSDFAGPVNAIPFGEDIVVAELGTGSVVRQTPEGERTTLAEGLMVPSGLAATADDLWVTDWASGTVWQIMTDGQTSMTEVVTGLANPEGITVEADGSLLVVESGAGRLLRVLPTGEVQTLSEGLPTGALAPPDLPPAWAFSGVAVCKAGDIYLTSDTDSVVWRLAGATASVE
ncbi:MAG: hypothetical protein R6W93_07645 [Candidatus Limnocylindrales bacterium]